MHFFVRGRQYSFVGVQKVPVHKGLVFQLVHQGIHLDVAGVQQEPDQCGRVQHLSAVAEKTRKREAHEVRAGIICANIVLNICIGNVKERNLTFATFSRTGTHCSLTTPEGATRPQQVLKKHFIKICICSYFDLLPIENLIG